MANKKIKKNPNKNNKGIKPQLKMAFGPVSSIATAPVSIGNTIRAAKHQVFPAKDGMRVIGRDFVLQAGSTVAAITGWQLIGGFPVTPACLVSSGLRGYTQTYQKFKINYLCIHFITASPTSQSGDVILYYERDRLNPVSDYTNNSFLPFILSDSDAIIGPQWMNHSVVIKPTDNWNTTNYAINTDINQESSGEILIYSKTSAANSPGYLLMDYDISFRELEVNVRSGLLPIPRAIYQYMTVGKTSVAVTAGSNNISGVIQGNNPDGTGSSLPANATPGDVYRMVACVTASTVSGVNSAWTNVTTSNLFEYSTSAFVSGNAITLDDGFTCYGLYTGSSLVLYPTLDQARTNSLPIQYGVTATVTWSLCFLASLVAQLTTGTQGSY
jgi:hypothetical protein